VSGDARVLALTAIQVAARQPQPQGSPQSYADCMKRRLNPPEDLQQGFEYLRQVVFFFNRAPFLLFSSAQDLAFLRGTTSHAHCQC
jgi:hypothetical protein